MFTMFQAVHRVVCWTVIVVAVFGAAARAQFEPGLVVTVPFEFQIGGKKMPAGNYLLRAPADAQTVVVTNERTGLRAYQLINQRPETFDRAPRKVVFRRFGETHFLAEVWMGKRRGLVLTPTKEEAKLAKASEGSTVAIMGKPAR
jgi:hypothetical protein